MDRLTITFNMPVDLCSYVLQHKLYKQFQLYIYLKAKCSGTINISTKFLKTIADDLGIKSYKTVRSNLTKLIKLNWVGFCSKSNLYFIRGFERVAELSGFAGKHGCDFDIRDIRKIKAFVCGVLVCKLCYIQKWKQVSIEQYKGCSVPNRKMPNDTYYPVACNALVKYYKVSKGFAFKMKSLAKKYGYIVIKPDLELTDFLPSEVNRIKKYNSSEGNSLTVIGRHVYLQKPDLILPCLTIRRINH